MDPEVNLAEQLRISERILKRQGKHDEDSASPSEKAAYRYVQAHDAERLAELVQALDEWIKKGGFLPRAWVK